MKNFNLLAWGITGLILASCVEEKDLSNSGNGDAQTVDTQVGLTADFSLKKSVNISISIAQADGIEGMKGVKFGIYTSLPYSQEEGADGVLETPCAICATNDGGQVTGTIVVPRNVSTVYIVPLTSGYVATEGDELQGYAIQGDAVTATFQPVAFPTVQKTRAAFVAYEDLTIVKGISSNFPNLNIIYADAQVSANGIPVPQENGGSSLVSKEALSINFLNQVNSWYPEKQNVKDANLDLNSDLRVVDDNGAEVWVTYMGDGGFYISNRSVYNSLMYYNYTEGDLANMSAEVVEGKINPSNLHMTMLLPNTNPLQCPIGLKVQLLYWDEAKQQYSKIFPKGARIGFAVAREGYKKNGQAVTSNSVYNFRYTDGSRYYPEKNGEVRGNYYSTPQLNRSGKSQAVTRLLTGNECFVSGFDIRPFGDSKSDYDFNDVLIKIASTPVKAIEAGADIPVEEEVLTSEATYGTLAFEDQWPSFGDYDMNDLVVNYTYLLSKNDDNKIAKIKLVFEPIAKGAASYTKIGFGIELPVSASNVKEVEGAALETIGSGKATIIVWNDVNENISAFKNAEKVNTQKGTHVSVDEVATITVTLDAAIAAGDLSVMKFNPFIFVGDRSREVHLPDYMPTSKMDMTLLGTEADCSDASKGIYFRMKDQFAWALDFPRESASAAAWKYPAEKEHVNVAYPGYSQWVVNKTDISWFEAKNAVEELIYSY